MSDPLTILVVDDHPQVRSLAVRMLEMLGHRTLAAESAAEAERLCATHLGAVDVALVDMLLPDGDGLTLADRLASSRPDLRVLFMSGYGQDAMSAAGLSGPGRGFLGKPFSLNALETALRGVGVD